MAIVWEQARGIVYTRNQAEGAFLNGTRVEKVHADSEDGHRDGALGTVVGSVESGEVPGYTDRYVYWVAWDDDPGAGLPVGIREGRVKEVTDG